MDTHSCLQEMLQKKYVASLGSGPAIADLILAFSEKGLTTGSPEDMLMYDSMAIEAGMKKQDATAYIAYGACELADYIDEVYKETGASMLSGTTAFMTAVTKGIGLWKAAHWSKTSPIKTFMSKQSLKEEDFLHAVCEVSTNLWLMKMKTVHGQTLSKADSKPLQDNNKKPNKRIVFLGKLDAAVWVEKRLFPARLMVLDEVEGVHTAQDFVVSVINSIPQTLNVIDSLPSTDDPRFLETAVKESIMQLEPEKIKAQYSECPHSILEQFMSDLNIYGLREALAYLFEYPDYTVKQVLSNVTIAKTLDEIFTPEHISEQSAVMKCLLSLWSV
jgi:hypothetical protein